MRIHSLQIDNFRGIKSLQWLLPSDEKIIVLIGPGDTGKSTILEAIHYLLGDRWNINFSDTDFYLADPSKPISIRAVLTDIPSELTKDNNFGLWMSGIAQDGTLRQDPEDECMPALITRLTVDDSLEPKWTVERVDGQTRPVSSVQRRYFSTFKVDDRIDTQLRWTRTSALGRLSLEDGGEREALAAASRAAQDALAGHESAALEQLTSSVQARTNNIGGGKFSAMRPGLDTSRSALGATLALYEDVIPLTSFGLGSRRLVSLAIQQLAAGSRAIAVIDELENGLEPHRAARLLTHFAADENYSQVFITTHSPVVVEQAKINSLTTIQSQSGEVVATSLSGAPEVLQRLRRARPSSLLARKVIVVEGKTEYGLLSACIDSWNQQRAASGLSTSVGEGVAIQDAQGGSEVALRATALASLGYSVATLMDNDDTSVDAAVGKALKAGVLVARWTPGNNTESQVCSPLETEDLTLFLKLPVETGNHQNTVLEDLKAVNLGCAIDTLDVGTWINSGISLDTARSWIVKSAVKRKWFKEIDNGRLLGQWLLEHQDNPRLAETWAQLQVLRAFIYGPNEHGSNGNLTTPAEAVNG